MTQVLEKYCFEVTTLYNNVYLAIGVLCVRSSKSWRVDFGLSLSKGKGDVIL